MSFLAICCPVVLIAVHIYVATFCNLISYVVYVSIILKFYICNLKLFAYFVDHFRYCLFHGDSRRTLRNPANNLMVSLFPYSPGALERLGCDNKRASFWLFQYVFILALNQITYGIYI